MTATDIGLMTSPALMALNPRTDWRKMGIVKNTPIMLALSMSPVTLPAKKLTLRNSEKSMSGWCMARSRR